MYEQKTEEIISTKDRKSTIKISRFLKPISPNTSLTTSIPKTPFLYEVFRHKRIKKWPFKVHFSGWKKPRKNWEKWYYKLVINHGNSWLNAGILDAIHSSMHKIPCNKELVLGVCEFWCSETNTFVFPWGEATITLEDVMVLGGFPVLGGSIHKAVEAELVGIVDELKQAKRLISSNVVTHSAWMKHFMYVEEDGEIVDEVNELEHVAFLVLWLCRFVFPDLHEGLIKKHVFPIAAHLSKGTPLCIAPIVLANLYNDLTMLVQRVNDPRCSSKKVNVSGLFKIVQLWVCERFPVFAERFAKPLSLGDPRVARWDNVDVKLKLVRVRSKLMSGEGFRWRPYADGLENWEILPFYEEEEQIVDNSVDFPCEELPSYSSFCHPCMLVGFKCKEKYNPHRVAMQFGFDQDVPGENGVSNTVFDRVGFSVPSRNVVPGMTRRYYEWWKDSMLSHKEAVINALRVKAIEACDERIVAGQRNINGSDSPRHVSVQEVADAPVMSSFVSVPASNKKQLTKEPSSLEEGEIRECPEVSKKVTMTSPGVLESNSREIHAAVSPHLPQIEADNFDVSSDLDHVPLASRISPKVEETKKHRRDEITRTGSQSLDNKTVTLVTTECESSSGNDKDHLSLALRLQTIRDVNRARKPIESHASIVNVQNRHRRPELSSPILDDAISKLTRKRSSSFLTSVDTDKEAKANKARKEKLEVRVSRLERDVAKLGVFQFGLEFLDE